MQDPIRKKLSDAVLELDITRIKVDQDGRILINDKALGDALKAANPGLTLDSAAFLDNCTCTTNQCRPA